MTPIRLPARVKPVVDAFDVVFGLLPWMAAYAAFVTWARLIVRALRGEEAVEDWRVTVASAAYIAARAMVSATHVREDVALRGSVAEMRELVREAARDAEERDKRAAAQQDALYRITATMAWVAGLTLAAAITTLVVTIVQN